MRKVVKLVFSLMFFLGVIVSAKAQDSSANMPSEDDAIVCVQVSEDMFDCYIMEDSTGAETNPGYNDGTSKNPSGKPGDRGKINKDDQWNKSNGDTDTTNWNRSDQNRDNKSDRPSGKGKEIDGGSEVKEHNRKGLEIYKEEDDSNPGIQAMKK